MFIQMQIISMTAGALIRHRACIVASFLMFGHLSLKQCRKVVIACKFSSALEIQPSWQIRAA